MRKLYVSHSADLDGGKWFIVEPRDNPERQVESLRRAGRTVYELKAKPWGGKSWRERRGYRRIVGRRS